MLRIAALVTALLLSGCGGGGGTTPPAPLLLPIPAAGWAITESSLVPLGSMIPLGSPSFAFPICGSASTCWVSYVEMAYTAPLSGSSLELDYEIVAVQGTSFFADSPGNNCTPLIPSVSLIIHRGPDTGIAPAADQNRWFSQTKLPVMVGAATLRVPLQQASWGAVLADGTAAGWSSIVANPNSIGIGLGGGCFAAHGVAANNVAQMNVLGYKVVP